MMPVMGGVELITHIRANPETAGLPVVAELLAWSDGSAVGAGAATPGPDTRVGGMAGSSVLPPGRGDAP